MDRSLDEVIADRQVLLQRSLGFLTSVAVRLMDEAQLTFLDDTESIESGP